MPQKRRHSESSEVTNKDESFCLCATHPISCQSKSVSSFEQSSLQCKSFQNKLSEFMIPKKQMDILICDYLQSTGFDDIAARLRAKSGYEPYQSGLLEIKSIIASCEPMTVFNSVERLFPGESESTYMKIKKILFMHYCEEMLKRRDQVECLKFMRKYCSVVKFKSGEIYEIVQVLIYINYHPTKFKETLISSEQTLDRLIQQINVLIPLTCYSSTNRLKTLMKYALLYQFDKCYIHSSNDPNAYNLTLLTDHSCTWADLPCQISESFEVPGLIAGCLAFSNNGELLAVSTLANTVFVYYRNPKTCTFNEYKVLRFDAIPETFQWSYDDSMLLVVMTCGRYAVFSCKLQAEKGNNDTIIRTAVLGYKVTATTWIPDNLRYFLATDEGIIYMLEISGNIYKKLEHYRAYTLTIMNDSQNILFTDNLNRLLKWNFVTQDVETLISYSSPITGVLLTPDCEYALLSCLNKGCLLFHLRFKSILRFFNGIQPNYLASHCAFYPGKHSKLFVAGSTNGILRIYHIDKNYPVHSLSGSKEDTVFDVTWNPKNPNMMATITENCTITIWETD